MTPTELDQHLRCAAWTLAQQPDGRPGGYRVMWPGVPPDSFYAFWNGLTEKERAERREELNAVRAHPTASQVGYLDTVLIMVYGLDRDTRWLVWAIASGKSLRWVGRQLGHDKNWIKRRYNSALSTICWGV